VRWRSSAARIAAAAIIINGGGAHRGASLGSARHLWRVAHRSAAALGIGWRIGGASSRRGGSSARSSSLSAHGAAYQRISSASLGVNNHRLSALGGGARRRQLGAHVAALSSLSNGACSAA